MKFLACAAGSACYNNLMTTKMTSMWRVRYETRTRNSRITHVGSRIVSATSAPAANDEVADELRRDPKVDSFEMDPAVPHG